MNGNRAVLFFLLMLIGHVAHVFEEIWERFWLVAAVYGLGWFLIINWILWVIPVVLFYFFLRQRRWTYYLSMTYGGIMILNGIGHNLATLVSGRYFDGFAGGFTGIGLVLIGFPMIYYLWKSMPGA